MRLRLAAAIMAALALSACANAPASNQAGTKSISSGIWGYYQEYLRLIGPNRPGAFAVSEDGFYAFGFYCKGIRCMGGPTYKREALANCRSYAKKDCYVFAFGRDIIVDYKIRP